MSGADEDKSLRSNQTRSHGGEKMRDEDVEKSTSEGKDRNCCDAVSSCPHDTYRWFVDLGEAFSFSFLFLLFSVMCLIKGFGNMFMSETSPFIYKEFNVPGPQMQVYLSSQKLPWSIKPAVGMLSDLVPINGYRKFPYALVVTIIGLCCVLTLGFILSPSMHVLFAVACIIGFFLQVSFMDLMCQAKFAELLKRTPEKGPDLVSFNWINIEVGALYAVLWVGILVEIVGPFIAVTVLIPAAGVVLYPLFKGWFHETQLTKEDVATECAIMMEQKPVFAIAIFLSVTSVILCLGNMLFYEPTRQAILLFFIIVAIIFGMWLCLRPSLAMTNTYFMLVRLTHIDIKGATFYFFTNNERQFPEGPHFSPTFYVAGVGLTVAFLQMLAIFTYNRFMKHCTYRQILLWPVFIHVAASLADVLLYTRYNVVLGIPDAFFILGSTAVHTASDMWQFMPSQVILAQLCPKGRLQATIYAILASSRNLGMTGGGFIGAFLLSWFDVQPAGRDGESHQFDNLWKVQLFVAFAPLLTIPLMWLLIPDAKQTDKLIQHHEGSATHGSLWERWNGDSQVAESEEVPIHARRAVVDTNASGAGRTDAGLSQRVTEQSAGTRLPGLTPSLAVPKQQLSPGQRSPTPGQLSPQLSQSQSLRPSPISPPGYLPPGHSDAQPIFRPGSLLPKHPGAQPAAARSLGPVLTSMPPGASLPPGGQALHPGAMSLPSSQLPSSSQLSPTGQAAFFGQQSPSPVSQQPVVRPFAQPRIGSLPVQQRPPRNDATQGDDDWVIVPERR